MVAHEAHIAEREPRNTLPWPAPPDPGDLSRRITRRRTELKLSIAQVADRARLSLARPSSTWKLSGLAERW